MKTAQKSQPEPARLLPVGTQVVVRVEIKGRDGKPRRPKGLVGTVEKAPVDHSHKYLIKLPDGSSAALKRHELAVLKSQHSDALQELGGVLEEYDLYQHVIYRCVTGSRAYGLAGPDSDEDRRGIYLPPADLHWSIFGVPEQLENPDAEECYWELQKFVTLALKANPNILECLYTPLVEFATPLAKELVAIRSVFLSKMIYTTYNGYAMSQFKKIEQDLRNHGQVKWKHAMHLVRLLLCGIRAMEEKRIPVDVGDHREKLLSIRRGELPWDEINRWRRQLHQDFEAAFQRTALPDRPDYGAANEFMIRARRSAL